MLISPESRNYSLFRVYSLGVVAMNKERTSNDIEVTPIEQLTMLDGELTSKTTEYEARAETPDGMAYEENLTTTATVKATWLPLGQSNRQTAPDVRRGEEVLIYQYADADQYYWDTLRNNVALRKLETVVWAWSDTRDEGVTQASPEDTYTLTLSTHDGHITLQTAKANQEPYRYTFQFNTKEGNVSLSDDIGNLIKLDSKPKHILLKNADGSLFELIGNNANWKVSDTITINAGKAINIGTKQYDMKSTQMSTKGERTHTGNSAHLGNLGIVGGLSGTAGGGDDGSAIFEGGIRTRKDIIAGNISLMHHRHQSSVQIGPPI